MSLYTLKEQKERATKIVDKMKEVYPDARCSLIYDKPYELLIATRLSAQCTDARVNLVTPTLFSTYPTLTSLANAKVADICEIIRSCGLYKTKGADIVAMCQMIRDVFGGELPDTIEELTAFLHEAGFSDIKVYGNLKLRAPKPGEDRLFFVARKDS